MRSFKSTPYWLVSGDLLCSSKKPTGEQRHGLYYMYGKHAMGHQSKRARCTPMHDKQPAILCNPNRDRGQRKPFADDAGWLYRYAAKELVPDKLDTHQRIFYRPKFDH